MKRCLGISIVLASLARLGVAGDFVGLDAPNQVIYDIDSQTGRVLALRKLVVPAGLVLGAMDRGVADPYSTFPRLMVNGAFGSSNFDTYLVREAMGDVVPGLDVFGSLGGGEVGLALGFTFYVLSNSANGAFLEGINLYGLNYTHSAFLIGSVSGQEAFGIASSAGAPGLYLVLKDSSGSRLARIINAGPLDQDLVGPLLNVDDSLGFTLQEHPTPGFLYLFSPGDEALYTLDVATAATSLASPLPGSAQLTSFAPRVRFRLEFCHGGGELEAGCGGCPCSNDAPLGSNGGCLNSLQRSGRLFRTGAVSPGSDTLRFEATQLPPSSFAILVAGQSALPIQGACPLGSGISSASLDGKRCVGNGVVRLGTRGTDTAGEIGSTNPGWGAIAGSVGGLGAAAGISSGQTRYFQAFYRDEAAVGCGTGINTTQAIAVTAE